MAHDTTAVLLVGGMGTRLRSVVPSKPKPLACLGGRPFLELLISQLRHQGIHRLVMCTGHLARQIENELGDGHKFRVEIRYSHELQPLGTAGAVKLARHYLQDAADFLVMNGDSFLEIDYREFIRFHREHSAVVTMAVFQVQDASRYGNVQVDSGGRVTSFGEKTGSTAPGLVNAGVYVFNGDVLDHMPEGPASLETDVFPLLLKHGIYALEQHGTFIDIGTPEDYVRAQAMYDHLSKMALRH